MEHNIILQLLLIITTFSLVDTSTGTQPREEESFLYCLSVDSKKILFYNFFKTPFKFCRYFGRFPPSIPLFLQG